MSLCRESCGIVFCQKRLDHGYRFCDECPEYPCEDVMEKENRYMSEYPVKESPLQNLKDIRSIGMEAFLLQEKEKWTCRICGSPVCVHTGICCSCGSKKKD